MGLIRIVREIEESRMTSRLSNLNNCRLGLSLTEKEFHLGMLNLRCILDISVELMNREFTVGEVQKSFILIKKFEKNDIKNHETGYDHKV